MQLLYIIASTILVSLGGILGVVSFWVKRDVLDKALLFLVSLSAGAFIGGAFMHLLPEAAEQLESETLFFITLVSFVLFFLIEKVLHWRHCHKGHCDVHSFGEMNLFGDAFHNFLDGLIIAAAYSTSTTVGIATTLAVALHEIPQEIGDFGVLLFAGWSRKKALISNYIVAATAIVGGIMGYFFTAFPHISPILMAFAAGGFIYVASSDLMPEIRKETNVRKSLLSFGVFILGILLMYAFTFFEGAV